MCWRAVRGDAAGASCPAAPMQPLQCSLPWPHWLTGSADPKYWGESQGLDRGLGGEVQEAAACFVCLKAWKSSHGLHNPFWSQKSIGLKEIYFLNLCII